LTMIGTAVPMKKASPVNTAESAGDDDPPPCACRLREITVKDRQPTRPDRFTGLGQRH
jgi:hypothetical protein